MNLVNLVTFIFVVINFGIIITVLRQNPRSKTNLSFSIFSFIATFWALSVIFENEASKFQRIILFNKIDFTAGPFVSLSLLLFVLYFARLGKKNTRRSFLLLAPAIFFALLAAFTNLIVKKIEIQTAGEFNQGKILLFHGELYYFFYFYHVISLFTAFYHLLRLYNRSYGIKKVQLGYVAAGLLATAFCWIGGSTISLLATNFQEGCFGVFSRWSIFGIIFSTVLISYAIIRHRFFDIKIILKRCFIYAIFLSFFLGTYSYVLTKSTVWLEKTFAISPFFVCFIFSFIGIFSVKPFINPLRRFCRRHISEEFRLYKITREFNAFLKLKSLSLETFLKNCEKMMAVSGLNFKTTFFLFDAECNKFHLQPASSIMIKDLEVLPGSLRQSYAPILKQELRFSRDERNKDYQDQLLFFMEKNNFDLLLPLRNESEFFGLFAFKNQEAGSFITREKIEFFAKIQPQVTAALNSLLTYRKANYRLQFIPAANDH